jgi:hypothetical protein
VRRDQSSGCSVLALLPCGAPRPQWRRRQSGSPCAAPLRFCVRPSLSSSPRRPRVPSCDEPRVRRHEQTCGRIQDTRTSLCSPRLNQPTSLATVFAAAAFSGPLGRVMRLLVERGRCARFQSRINGSANCIATNRQSLMGSSVVRDGSMSSAWTPVTGQAVPTSLMRRLVRPAPQSN